MPDALSKTIPIWCSVINRFLFPDQNDFQQFYTPPQVVSESEHAQIAALLPRFLVALQALEISAQIYKSHISKPLRPIWITPDSQLTPTKEVFAEFHPIICCTVSRRVTGGELSEGGYIQGAGDDTENWAYGLTPAVFWANNGAMLSTPEPELPDLIVSLVQHAVDSPDICGELARCIKPTSCLFVSTLSAAEDLQTSTNTFKILLLPNATKESAWVTSSTKLDVGLGSHKLGSRNLRAALPVIIDFARKVILSGNPEDRHVLIACESGKDLSIGVALALLCLFFDADGNPLNEDSPTAQVDKAFIRRRLGWISTCMPDAHPSRATLRSVNSYLMDRP
jgi:tRNA A64-2'-O-ribosylphosphate transferase